MFDRYKFLELFDAEQIIDEEVDIKKYILFHEDFTFSLYISRHEGVVILTLCYKKAVNPIYEIELNDVSQVAVKSGVSKQVKLLFFYKNKEKSIITVMLKPELSLQCQIIKLDDYNKFQNLDH